MQQLNTIKRATVGMSALGWIALACLTLNGAFWGMLMLGLLQPASILSAQTLQAALAIVAFALVLPLFWSMLLPSSPAGRLLQKQTWRLPGQLAVTFAAVFLTWMAATWLRLWWAAQPNVVDVGQDLFLTITSLIAGILVPALSWCVMTPEQWIAQIEQARHVRRLEHAMQMEEAAMRAAYARAVSLLNADLSSLTIAQRQELAGILGGFARTQQHALAQIAASWKDMYGVEAALATVPDEELLASYRKVAGLLTQSADIMKSSADYADDVRPVNVPNDRPAGAERSPEHRTLAAHQDTADRVRPNDTERPNDRTNRTTSGPLADHRTTERPPHEQAYQTARQELTGAWERSELERALSISKTQAHTYITAWVTSGDLDRLTEPKNHYRFVED